MHDKRLFRTNGGGALILLPLLMLTLFSTIAKGQGDQCAPVDCNTGQLSVEVVKQFPNVTTGCPSALGCGNGDAFHQIFYKVYLRYSRPDMTPGNPANFKLSYNQLKVTIGLVNNVAPPNTSIPVYSRIDKTTTQSCYNSGPGVNWDPMKVIFSIDENLQTVAIDFMNSTLLPGWPSPPKECGDTGEEILMTFGTPAGATPCSIGSECFYVELFSVVVNAFPREGINLVANSPIFQSFSGITCPVGSIGFNPLIVEQPGTFNNTFNQNLQLKVADAIAASNGMDQDFHVEVTNNDPHPLSITYLEFLVQATSAQSPPLHFSGANIPRVVEINGERFLHYIVAIPGGVLLTQGQTYSIGTITASPPNPVNQSWGITFSLGVNLSANGYLSRVKTNAACTALPFEPNPTIFTSTGTIPACTDLGNTFVIRPKDNFCTQTPTIQAGIRIKPSGILNFTRFVFEIEFELTGNMAITGVNLDDWALDPDWDCEIPVSSCLPPDADAPCYDIVGDNVVRFCLSVLGANERTLTDESYINIEFNNSPECISKATVRYLELVASGVGACVPPIENALSGGNSACPPQARGHIATEPGHNTPVEGATVALTTDLSGMGCSNLPACDAAPCLSDFKLSDKNGNFAFCVCPACNCFNLAPEKTDNPLNGVTTYDLVLISKHILGLEPLNSPYKMIAADANKSGSITTFDIVELRKLILGLYVNLPLTNSWRFVPKNFAFPNPNNPFQLPAFPEDIKHFSIAGGGTADFIGIKVGDVNNTVVSNRPTERPNLSLSWPEAGSKKGGVLTIPVTYSGNELLEAIQLGLRYDPAVLQLLSPSQGDLSSWDAGSFNLQPGTIRTLWLPLDPDNPEQRILPGTVLFYLTFKVLTPIPESGLPLWTDNEVLDNIAWQSGGKEFALQYSPAAAMERNEPIETGFNADCHPNPGSGALSFSIHSEKAGKCRVALFSPYGVRMLAKDVTLTTGEQEISLPEAAQLPVGVYTWRVASNGARAEGHWVKQ